MSNTFFYSWFRKIIAVWLIMEPIRIFYWATHYQSYLSLPVHVPIIGNLVLSPIQVCLLLILTLLSGVGILLLNRYQIACIAYTICYAILVNSERVFYSDHSLFILLTAAFLACTYYSTDLNEKWNASLLRLPIYFYLIGLFLSRFSPDWWKSTWLKMTVLGFSQHSLVGALYSNTSLLEMLQLVYLAVFIITIRALYKKKILGVVLTALIIYFEYIIVNKGLVQLNAFNPFPWLEFSLLLLFIPQFQWQKWSQSLSDQCHKIIEKSDHIIQASKTTLYLLGLYLIIQLILPIRQYIIPTNVHWTFQGHYFSWTMKLTRKQVALVYYSLDPETKEKTRIDVTKYINKKQFFKLKLSPYLIHKFAVFLAKKEEGKGNFDPYIVVDCHVSINGKSYKRFIDPSINLATVNYHPFKENNWVLPNP